MRCFVLLRWTAAACLICGVAACDKQSAAPADGATDSVAAAEPRKPPEFKDAQSGGNPSMAQMMAAAKQKTAMGDLPPGHPAVGTSLPAGHPPVGSMPAQAGTGEPGALPPGHPPIGAGNDQAGETSPPEQMLQFNAPATWTSRKLRPMTAAIYGLPKAAGDAEDAELTISHFPGMKNIPLESQVSRWAAQFEQPDGKPTSGVVKQAKLANAAHPTTTVDISGRFKAGSMSMSGSVTVKENYRMVVAYVETDDGPWFLRLVGPQATIASHYDEFLKFAREAK